MRNRKRMERWQVNRCFAISAFFSEVIIAAEIACAFAGDSRVCALPRLVEAALSFAHFFGRAKKWAMRILYL
jgi:hypothetical protein